MWFKLDSTENNCLAINSEIVYAYLTFREYKISAREKYAEISSRMKSYHIKRLYKNFKTQNSFSKQVRNLNY